MKVSVYIAVSMDGYIARKDGDIEWLHCAGAGTAEPDYGYDAFMATIDTLVMGRNTFEKVLSFGSWPYQNIPVVVLSGSELRIPQVLEGIVERCNLALPELLDMLENRGVQHIYVDGGQTIQSFLREGLVHEIVITRVPRLIGSGISLFGEIPGDIQLRHENTHVFRNGFVQSTYAIV